MNHKKVVKLFVNSKEKAKEVADVVTEKLIQAGFFLGEENFDYGIAIGGDGTFLRMVKESAFSSDVLFVGINAGTLGFSQDFSTEEIDSFIECLKFDHFSYEEIGIGTMEIVSSSFRESFSFLNEIVVRDENLKTMEMDVSINGVFLEKYVGDGLLVSTSYGSTAYNLSFGGGIVYPTFPTLQITPVAPLNNKSYRNLMNSLILPSSLKISLSPFSSVVVTVDGDNHFLSNILSIDVFMDSKVIKVIRKSDYNFIHKINDKFLK